MRGADRALGDGRHVPGRGVVHELDAGLHTGSMTTVGDVLGRLLPPQRESA
jgi:hypothetical protein